MFVYIPILFYVNVISVSALIETYPFKYSYGIFVNPYTHPCLPTHKPASKATSQIYLVLKWEATQRHSTRVEMTVYSYVTIWRDLNFLA
jgi:hypothetical protein